MSYQFEDDSALEELLNQQLDRKRRANIDKAPKAANVRPSTQSSYVAQQNEPSSIGSEPKSKLASWLDANAPIKQPATLQDTPESTTVSAAEIVAVTQPKTSSSINYNAQPTAFENLNEDGLKEMSKQRLISLILTQILPSMKVQQEKLEQDKSIKRENEKLRLDLQQEHSKVDQIESKHEERLKFLESSWMTLNKQFELRLELKDEEAKAMLNRQKDLTDQIESSYKEQMNNLNENYKARLSAEKEQFEELFKRKDEFHRLELESKLKVDCDLTKLQSISDEWNKMVRRTIEELDFKLNSVEQLSTNRLSDIADRTSDFNERSRQLLEIYTGYDKQNEKLVNLASEMESSWPNFLKSNEQNCQMLNRLDDQLKEFLPLNNQLRAQERELQRLKDELMREYERMAQEKFQLGLDSNRLSYREERLRELETMNEAQNEKLSIRAEELNSKETELRMLRESFAMKTSDLKEQNFELHQTRRKLLENQDDLKKLEQKIDQQTKDLNEKQLIHSNELKEFQLMKQNAQKELSQLKRLQKSLICSLCLDRLYKFGQKLQPTDNNNLETYDFKMEFQKLNQYIDLDGRKLASENKYVQILSSTQ